MDETFQTPTQKISRNEKETDHCRGWRSAGIHPRWKSKKSTEKRETTPQHTIYTGNSLTKTVVDVSERERERCLENLEINTSRNSSFPLKESTRNEERESQYVRIVWQQNANYTSRLTARSMSAAATTAVW